MKFAFVLADNAVWLVHMMCEVLGVSRSGYYARPAIFVVRASPWSTR
jgi:hypothetical protein